MPVFCYSLRGFVAFLVHVGVAVVLEICRHPSREWGLSTSIKSLSSLLSTCSDTPTLTSRVSSNTITTSAGSGNEMRSGGLNESDKIALSVELSALILAYLTLINIWRCSRRYRDILQHGTVNTINVTMNSLCFRLSVRKLWEFKRNMFGITMFNLISQQQNEEPSPPLTETRE